MITNLILSNIDYCNSLLAGATNKALKPLQKMINRSVRFIYDLKKIQPTSQFAFRAHFLPIYYRIQFKICLLAHKIIRGLSPDYLLDGLEMFHTTTKINLRAGQGRDSLMFKYPPVKSSQNSLFHKLISNWNGLPHHLRATTTLDNFKIKLKTYLFKKASPSFIDHS